MIAEQPVERFVDLEDGPESLGRDDDGKIPQYSWQDGRFVMVDMPKSVERPQVGIAAIGAGSGGGGTSTIAGASDFTDTTGAGTDGYSVVWDNATSKFILSEITGGGGSPGGSNTQVQYNSSGNFAGHSGFTYDGAGTATLGTALVAQVIKPAIDNTAAVQIQSSTGNPALVVNTTDNVVYCSRGTSNLNLFMSGGGNTTATGTSNVCFGTQAGSALTTGNDNNNFGSQAGQFINSGAGNNNFGTRAGNNLTTGSFNNNYGFHSGRFGTTGSNNNNFGYQAGHWSTSGLGNNNFGYQTGFSSTTGSFNVYIGYRSGYSATDASKNIFIGNNAGFNETNGNKLHIGNNQTLSLLEGTMGTTVGAQSLSVHGDLEVDGDAGFYGTTPVAQASHIAEPSGGSTIDSEARDAIDSILVVLENLGLTASS